MAVHLRARPGDPQALKAAICAQLAGLDISLKSDAAVESPFGSQTLSLTTESGLLVHEANVIARVVGGSSVLPAKRNLHVVESWLDWEERCLRPAVLSAHDEQLQQALAKLESRLSKVQYLAGADLSVADVAVYCTLFPLIQQGSVSKPVADYLGRIGALPAVQTATAQVLADQPAGRFLEVLQQDVAAYSAKVPRGIIKGQRNILITSALPYVNNVPHLGNIIGCVLSADCYARYCRARGHNCIYMCGTDEYGTATETKALEEGLSCQQICDKYNAIHADIYRWFDIAFDKFGRTPTRQQTEICQAMFMKLWDNGCLIEQSMEQLYSEALGKFLADRFVTGTCPKCGYTDARGDQCDSCGTLMNPTELINPKCKLTGTTPVIRSTRHIFLDLPKLSPQLQEYITTTSEKGGWSANCVQVTNAWMRDGLKQRCITRDLKWGIPVPLPGYEDKVFYVWFDAPIGYISITANYTQDWQQWWNSPEDVELVQFMGKDNVPFHTVIFPATLIGTGQPWTRMKNISVTEYLNYEGGKFSKSRGVGVFGNDAKETGIPVEVWRYYLLSNRPEQSDTDFKWADLAAKNNSELLANLGNFINRALVFVNKFFEGRVPAAGAPGKGLDAALELGTLVSAKLEEYVAAMERIKLKEGIRLAMAASADGNKFFQDTQPWVMVKQDPQQCANIVAAGVGLVRLLAVMIQPYMPSLTVRILSQLNLPASASDLPEDLLQQARQPHTLLPTAHQIGQPEVLIKQLPEDLIAQLRDRYSGSQSDRAAAAASASAGSASSSGKPAPAAPAAAAGGKAAKGGKSGAGAGAGAAAAAAAGTAASAAGGKGASKASEGASGSAPQFSGKGHPPPATQGADSSKGQDVEQPKKKEKVKKQPADAGGASTSGGKPAKAEERLADVSRLDIRVGRIRTVKRHPDADSLYVEEVDVGEAAPRQVVSGLVKFIPLEGMQDARVLLVCNLKPANMRGVQSQAMVLAASTADGGKVELVTPPEGAQIGERVTFEGYSGEPDEQLNPKKKIFEQVHPDFTTSADLIATYKGVPFMTSQGPCTVASIQSGNIR